MKPNCQTCGKFFKASDGYAWRMVYSGYPPTPDREVFRCRRCMDSLGGFEPQSGIRPECSCGVIQPERKDSPCLT